MHLPIVRALPMPIMLLAARGWLLAACIGVSIGMGACALALAREGGVGGEPTIAFDIPAQPLASALDAYSAATGREVFYDGSVGAGRRSTGVKGTLTPADALKTLLAGTSLLAVPGGANGYTLVVAPEELGRAAAAARIAADRPYMRYFALLQTHVRDALCRNIETRPGPYRILLRFWIGPSGAVQRSELSGSTGSAARDGRLVTTLEGVRLDEPPPANMPQPITMAIFPGRPAGPMGCPAGADDAVH